jgi:hypothetical protein
MTYRPLAVIALAAGLSACASGPLVLPVQATRYHYDPVVERGTVAVLPGGGPGATADSPEFQVYADAVRTALTRAGYSVVPEGSRPQNIATVDYRRGLRPLPPRRSPVQIGLGGGGYSGGWRGGSGVGGGVSFPLGGGGARDGIVTDMKVTIRRGPNAVWEGSAQSVTDASAPGADAGSIAARLADAMFRDFPGESGRTIQVK